MSAPRADHPIPLANLPKGRADGLAADIATSSTDAARPDRLPISETFVSLQGEGILVGVPSWFLRVSGCNLRCGWCDTPYASWTPESRQRSIEDLVQEAIASRVTHAVLTGGEPMLFDALVPLARELKKHNFHITIETAGTIDRDVPCDLLSVSPKLANSTPKPDDPRDPKGSWRTLHDQRRLNVAALQALIHRYPVRQFKFVVSSPHDLTEIDDLLGKLSGFGPGEIMLMPEGLAPPVPGAHDWVVRECLRRNWRYCSRLHLQLFGNKRGT